MKVNIKTNDGLMSVEAAEISPPPGYEGLRLIVHQYIPTPGRKQDITGWSTVSEYTTGLSIAHAKSFDEAIQRAGVVIQSQPVEAFIEAVKSNPAVNP